MKSYTTDKGNHVIVIKEDSYCLLTMSDNLTSPHIVSIATWQRWINEGRISLAKPAAYEIWGTCNVSRCTCGAAAVRSTHSHWCDIRMTHGSDTQITSERILK